VSPQARRRGSRGDASERRACEADWLVAHGVALERCESPPNIGLRGRILALAEQRRRFGYRRIHVLLRREGQAVNVEAWCTGCIARSNLAGEANAGAAAA